MRARAFASNISARMRNKEVARIGKKRRGKSLACIYSVRHNRKQGDIPLQARALRAMCTDSCTGRGERRCDVHHHRRSLPQVAHITLSCVSAHAKHPSRGDDFPSTRFFAERSRFFRASSSRRWTLARSDGKRVGSHSRRSAYNEHAVVHTGATVFVRHFSCARFLPPAIAWPILNRSDSECIER